MFNVYNRYTDTAGNLHFTDCRADGGAGMSVDMKDYIAYQQGYEAGKRDAASPWHRVEEELPSMDGYDWVLGIVTGEAGYLRFHKAVMMVSFDPQYKEWFIDEYPDARITVSHWMLLPEPPKEDA